ncbi:MAG: zinc metallopeptidase [Planctomycetota bacterium]|jgi:Zn-dependent membrane protease YugP
MLTYLLLMLPLLALSIWAGSRVKGTFARYNKIPIRSGFSGLETAQAMLRGAGIDGVTIEPVPGMMSDHYDPRHKVVRLSKDILHGRSAAAVAVAAHEVGHAIQDAQAYRPMQWRAAVVPAASLGSSLAIPMILAGWFLHIGPLVWLGVIGFSFAVLFHLVTLPVEYDASFRAMKILEGSGIVAADEMPGVKKTLYAAGFTYVAATLVAIVELLYWVMHAAGGD